MQNLVVTMKSAARRLIAPFARPLWRRIQPRLTQIDQLVKLNDAWHQHLPALMNATASVGAVAREQARMKRDYEVAFAEPRSAVGQLQPRRDGARIIAIDKVRRARADGARLNVGDALVDGCINVAQHGTAGADIVAPLDALPFDPAEVSELLAPRVLERFHPQHVQHKLLPHWVSLLKPGGTIVVSALDAKAMIDATAAGKLRLEGFRDALFDPTQADTATRNLFTVQSLSTALEDAGLVDVRTTVPAQGARAYEFQVIARKAAN